MEHAFEAYVTNLGKYNEGDLVGEWVKFPVSTKELQGVLERIGINEEYEETFITEYASDEVSGLNNHLTEYEQIDNLNYLARRIQELDPEELKQFNAVMGNNIDMDQEGAIGCINLTYNLDNYTYYPDVTTEQELGIYLVEELGMFDVNSMGEFSYYFDYEAYGRDASINIGGIFVRDGYLYKEDEEWTYEYDGDIQKIPDKYGLRNLAQNIKQQLGNFAKDEAVSSVNDILADLEAGNISVYKEKLNKYAEELYCSAAEMDRDASMGAEDYEDVAKVAKQYNEVEDTLNRLQDVSGDKLTSSWEAAVEEVLASAPAAEPDLEMEM